VGKVGFGLPRNVVSLATMQLVPATSGQSNLVKAASNPWGNIGTPV